MHAPLYLAIYDLADDRERTSVARVLEGHGFRIQYSAFECRLAKGTLARVRERLRHMNLQTGFVRLYRVDSRAKSIDEGCPPAHLPPAEPVCYLA